MSKDVGANAPAILAASRVSKSFVLHLIDKITANPRLLRAPPTDLRAFYTRALSSLGRRGIVFAVSDFISQPGWERGLFAIGQRHETLAVRLVDPLESALPDIGLMTFEDAETGEQLVVDTDDPAFRRRFAAAAEVAEEQLMTAFMAAGTDVLELSTGDDLVDAVLRFANMRKANARLGAGGSGLMVPA